MKKAISFLCVMVLMLQFTVVSYASSLTQGGELPVVDALPETAEPPGADTPSLYAIVTPPDLSGFTSFGTFNVPEAGFDSDVCYKFLRKWAATPKSERFCMVSYAYIGSITTTYCYFVILPKGFSGSVLLGKSKDIPSGSIYSLSTNESFDYVRFSTSTVSSAFNDVNFQNPNKQVLSTTVCNLDNDGLGGKSYVLKNFTTVNFSNYASNVHMNSSITDLVFTRDVMSPDSGGSSSKPPPPPASSTPAFHPDLPGSDSEYVPYDGTKWYGFLDYIRVSIGQIVNVGFLILAFLTGIYLILRVIRTYARKRG